MANKENYMERLRCILHDVKKDFDFYEVRGSKKVFKEFGHVLVLNKNRLVELVRLVKEMNSVIEKHKFGDTSE